MIICGASLYFQMIRFSLFEKKFPEPEVMPKNKVDSLTKKVFFFFPCGGFAFAEPIKY